MSARDTLLSTLPSEVRDAAAEVHQQVPDPRDVVAELHRRGLIKDGQLREAVMALESTLRIEQVKDRPPGRPEPTILGPLGAGAMGEVLLAKDEGLNRVVAVKRLHPELAAKPSIMKRFYKEAQVTAQLDHPSIVPIHGLVEDKDGGIAYAMKLVQGRTFEDYLDEARDEWQKSGRESGERALPARLERFLHVCEAVAYAHDRGVLHRDLKPENIMVGTFGQVMVMDWGIAKLLDGGPEEALPEGGSRKHHGTRVGTVMGTPRYMSPEQAAGRTDTMDTRSDQYSMGLILFEVASLRPAVSDDLDLDGCLQWAREGRKQKLQHLHRKGTVPPELAAIVDKATQPDPGRRYGSVSDLAEDIRRYLRDEAVLAKPDTLVQRLHRWVGRHRSLVLLMLMASAMMVGIVATGLLLAGLGAHEYRRWVASAREAGLVRWAAQTGSRAALLENQARSVEALLTGLTFTAEGALDRPPGDLDLNYDPVTDAPPFMEKSSIYGRPVSVERPGFALASGVDAGDVRSQIERLAVTSYQLSRVLVDSSGRSGDSTLSRKKRHELVANQGVPVLWARVGTQEGVLVQMPGFRSLKKGIDPRKASWYSAARGQTGVTWTGPAIDPDGMGAVMTGSLPAFDHRQKLMGVASVDLGLDALAALLDPPAGAEDAWLIDASGKLMVWEGMHARDMDAWSPKPMPHPDLFQEIKGGSEEGWVEAGGRIAWFKHLSSLDWTYVVVADDGVVW